MTLHCLSPMIVAAMIGSGLASSPAGAQSAPAATGSSPCAERGCPCQVADQLAVVQDAQGFSIRRRAEPAQPAPEPSAVPAPIALGAGLKLDARIFAKIAAKTAEAGNDARR